jgi:hypothetical protein
MLPIHRSLLFLGIVLLLAAPAAWGESPAVIVRDGVRDGVRDSAGDGAGDSEGDANATAVASDRAATDAVVATAEQVARELLQLQQQQGGSVVTDRPALADWHESPVTAGTAPRWSPGYRPQSQVSPEQRDHPTLQRRVQRLRKTARQLDLEAHALEILELYDAADAVRAVATRLRHAARHQLAVARAQRRDVP